VLTQYEQSNKTEEFLSYLQVDSYHNSIGPIVYSIVSLTSTVPNVLSKDFDKLSADNETQNELRMYLGALLLIALSILLKVLVIEKLKERDTEFRKILQAFPMDLVMKHFVLKSYLIQTSRGAFDSVRNQI